MNFGEAIEALNKGAIIARKGWNGKGLFVFKQVPADISVEIVPKMQSLPDSVKDVFVARQESGLTELHYRNQMAMVYPDNNIYGWLASPSDVFAEDWYIPSIDEVCGTRGVVN